METVTKTTKKVKWAIDPSHSEILFKVKHLMITNVKGEFRKFNVEVITQGDTFNATSIKAVLDATSIYTNEENRDTHLRSADFFDVENHKEIIFEGTSLKQVKDEKWELIGNLIIKGISREIKLDVEFGGMNKDPYGNVKAGFSLEGKINRKDWGLNWNAMLETGGVLVSDEVRINAEVQFVKQA
ncbi:MAG TPA: YceI family protein [Prolixibacteraceae bacterium]|nr:YceI family protein [Prolixibacteraceae bacterium]